jgi:hypothetical protein
MKWTLFVILIFIVSCTSVKNGIKISNETKLKLIGKYELPHNLEFLNTTVGGLSGIDYDRENDVYYLISDDGSKINPARFYKAKIIINQTGIESVRFLEVNYLKQKNGNFYPGPAEDPWKTPDPESIRLHTKNNLLLWANEGQKIYRKTDTIISNPAVIVMDLKGNYIDSFVIPSNMRMQKKASGPRNNGSFEGMSFSNDYKLLYVSMEEPLYEDGPRAGLNDSIGSVRIIKFNVKKRKPIGQYGYHIDPVAIPPKPSGGFHLNGISEILWINESKLLVIERSYSVGTKSSTIKLFLADLRRAADFTSYSGIDKINSHFIKKILLLNLNTLGIYVDNIEGMTFGPRLPNGHQSLILISDNNFDEQEISQFFIFEIE